MTSTSTGWQSSRTNKGNNAEDHYFLGKTKMNESMCVCMCVCIELNGHQMVFSRCSEMSFKYAIVDMLYPKWHFGVDHNTEMTTRFLCISIQENMSKCHFFIFLICTSHLHMRRTIFANTHAHRHTDKMFVYVEILHQMNNSEKYQSQKHRLRPMKLIHRFNISIRT